MLDDPRIRQVLFAGTIDDSALRELVRVEGGTATLAQGSLAKPAVRALQRLLIFLGYSTSQRGGYLVDGDFGLGTNRGVAQFQVEARLQSQATRAALCYECTGETAAARITEIPAVTLDATTLRALLDTAITRTDANAVTCGNVGEALLHLNRLEGPRLLSAPEIRDRYGALANAAVTQVQGERGITVCRTWVLAIIKQETGGVVRPRFEQHHLSRLNRKQPNGDLSELRLQSTSFGLGQVMGFNFRIAGAASAQAMLQAPLPDQVVYVVRYLAQQPSLVSKTDPTPADFAAVAQFYNGPAYAKNQYDQHLRAAFDEFRALGM